MILSLRNYTRFYAFLLFQVAFGTDCSKVNGGYLVAPINTDIPEKVAFAPRILQKKNRILKFSDYLEKDASSFIICILQFPMLFQVPKLSDPMIACIDFEVEKGFHPVVLGLGDVIVPGQCFF